MDFSAILASLPTEILNKVQHNSNPQLLHNLSECLLEPSNTDQLLPTLAPLLPELVARWLSKSRDLPAVITALGKIIPLQSQLLQHARNYLDRHQVDRTLWTSHTESELASIVLGLYRLCLQDVDCMTCFIRPAELLFGLQHSSRVVRYLVVRVLCLYLHAADAATQDLTRKYVGDGAIPGAWEDKVIDYRFFTLWEKKRTKDVGQNLERALQSRHEVPSPVAFDDSPQPLTNADLVGSVQVAGLLVAHTDLSKQADSPSEAAYVETPTSVKNMQSFVLAMASPQPILLTGAAGSGKTTMVNYLASRLGKLNSMVTLQLNEQSDVKILLGLYTSGQEPGTFVWKPGVLTTAVREGRWVFIEDLDRAPNEVISALLPLVERNELNLAGRGEVIKAVPGFKLIASIRTLKATLISTRQHSTNLIGKRFWNQVEVSELSDQEVRTICVAKFPHMASRADDLVRVFTTVRAISETQSFRVDVSSNSARAVTTRDFFKWCRRISTLFVHASQFTERTLDVLFLEAIDCFAGYLPAGASLNTVSAGIAQELQIDPDRRDHILQARNVKVSLREPGSKTIQVGRTTLPRSSQSRKRPSSSSRFSANPLTASLLEKIASAVKYKEPLLLVGETGTGKTTTVQYLANVLGKRLVPFNLSQQAESSDLLGGFKPVDTRAVVMNIQDEFDQLFTLSFSSRDNVQFAELLNKSIAKSQWRRVSKLWRGAVTEVRKRLLNGVDDADAEMPQKKKPRLSSNNDSEPTRVIDSHTQGRWRKLIDDIDQFEARLASSRSAFAFEFLEGNIVKAARNGDWILLDEINLAPSDTLEALSDLLNHDNSAGPPSILLTEAGKVERVIAHPEFRVFAAMNPATDIGKRDLPAGIRSRFTELYVESPDSDLRSLRHIVQTYLGDGITDKNIIADVAELHLQIQRLSRDNKLVDGSGQQPHFSLRTLTRSLTFAKDVAPLCGLRRGLYEGFSMSYLTFLDKASEELLLPLLSQHIFGLNGKAKGELNKALRKPEDGRQYISYRHFWLRQGNMQPQLQPHYIITPFVERNLDNLVRAIFSRRAPVLIQGPTSSGKTSMVEFLANISGNKFVRINNHEHTDLQEYLGTYVSDANGSLKFQEGILVEALRKGYWIVLDELNLAPSDVLEALNRLLDDNRELLIPETQETVKPHEDFMLFATQNPAGLYGGRKPLSRAFRNRFLELHFDDIPVDELCEILHQRTQIPESWSRRIVDAYKELGALRQVSRLFENKSFATLRDLFRWALRKADSVEQLAINGFMLLAERVRKPEEREKVKEVIEIVMSRRGPRVKIDTSALYSVQNSVEIAAYETQVPTSARNVVWTKAMRRLYVLVSHALRNNEPVLLVGETGCGKTTVCQMLAHAVGKTLHTVNAHQNTETGDLIGSQRPVRNRSAIEIDLRAMVIPLLAIPEHDALTMTTEDMLTQYDEAARNFPQTINLAHADSVHELRTRWMSLFEWSDGSLVKAMKSGDYFLLDEISLADDSVLERLNSVLEPQRALFLAEKGPIDSDVQAIGGFQFFATMNPGGDYGKRELSPALRNRFTEIWVPAIDDMDDVQDILAAMLPSMPLERRSILDFAQWFGEAYSRNETTRVSIRDILACTEFMKLAERQDSDSSLMHAISMVFVDALGANPAGMLSFNNATLLEQRTKCVARLEQSTGKQLGQIYVTVPELLISDERLQIGDFFLPRLNSIESDTSFTFLAPTTRMNAMRIVRALQMKKPLLIEGDPGVGKTTIISSLAKVVGKHLTRINLSEQTDLMDLFGSDVPMEDAAAGNFKWQDAPFLTAMKNGGWVLLDEMNLASQSILEGLNACLDHRGEVYIAELDQTFRRHPDFRLFAAQNPHHQGGGRKGLPASFVNRFTVVYADPFTHGDLNIICQHLYPGVDASLIQSLTAFVTDLNMKATNNRTFGALGSPWEFNLRDTLRWLQLSQDSKGPISISLAATAYDLSDIVFGRRFRAISDSTAWQSIFRDNFCQKPQSRNFFHLLTEKWYQVGLATMDRSTFVQPTFSASDVEVGHLPVVESLMLCVRMNWPVVLVGSSGSGKSLLLQHVAALHGSKLTIMTMNADIDATDLVGGFEQADSTRRLARYLSRVREIAQGQAIAACLAGDAEQSLATVSLLGRIDSRTNDSLDAVFMDCVTYVSRLAHSKYDLIDELKQEGDNIKGSSPAPEKATFEWVDGLLVQALMDGDWLVLDNANLCSSSVLDRLNSLLEPNGTLIISEHPLSNGEARIIKPHPNFRIFLTMDPKHGELSRAMRNRALELFVPRFTDHHYKHPKMSADAAMDRFDQLLDILSASTVQTRCLSDVLKLALDHLIDSDLKLLEAFGAQLSAGLMDEAGYTAASLEISHMSRSSEDSRWSAWYEQKADFLCLHEDIYTVQPLNNIQAVRCLPIGLDRVSFYGRVGDALHRQFAIEGSTAALDRLLADPSNSISSRSRNNSSLRLNALHYVNAQKLDVNKFLYLLLNRPLVKQNVAELGTFEDLQIHWLYLIERMSEAGGLDMHLQICLQLIHAQLASKDDRQAVETAGSFSVHQYHVLNQLLRLDARSGWFMEELWTTFKPLIPETHDMFLQLESLGALADEFDQQRWSSSADFASLSQTRDAFCRIAALLKRPMPSTDIQSLLQSVQDAMTDIKNVQYDPDGSRRPFFQQHFDLVRRRLELKMATHSSEDLQLNQLQHTVGILAGFSTRSTMNVAGEQNSQVILLQRLVYYHEESEEFDEDNNENVTLHGSLLNKVQKSGSVSLRNLALLGDELQVLGKLWARNANELCDDGQQELTTLLRLIKDAVQVSTDKGALDIHPDAQQELRRYLQPLQQFLGKEHPNSSPQLGLAYINLAIASILSYVPKNLIDPLAKTYVAADMQWFKYCYWDQRRAAFLHFDQQFDGTESLRAQEIIQRQAAIGDACPPPAKGVAQRPTQSQLDDLQQEFDYVLRIVNVLAERLAHGDISDDASRLSLAQIMKRLQHNYRAYADIVLPLVGFITMLIIGLQLQRTTPKSLDSQDQVQHGSLFSMLYASSDSFDVEELHRLCLLRAIHGGLSEEEKKNVQNISDVLYHDWKEQVEMAQEKNTLRSNLYTFKGSYSDEEEEDQREFDELFPETYNIQHDHVLQNGKDTFDKSVVVADLHHNIFVNRGSTKPDLLEYLRSSHNFDQSANAIEQVPTLLLHMKDRLDLINNHAAPSKLYNLYKDPNIGEALKLIVLVRKIQARFKTLQAAWPEHATLAEVLRLSTEMLDFAHGEPVAKFVTKSEKLHEAIYEWQKVASKEYTAASLYDELTDLIVSWRRLELSTWLRLFDLEVQACNREAKAWWFIAYESIIAASESVIRDEGDLSIHALHTVITLQKFMQETSIGQFVARLNLLTAFVCDIRVRLSHTPKLKVIYNALGNFISFYARFKDPVAQHIQKERLRLERDVKEVVQLASWKDTNIDALRQSAKTSHRKLFKVVRKFRALLRQPSSAIITRGPPGDRPPEAEVTGPCQNQYTYSDVTIAEIANTHAISRPWPARYLRISATVDLMRQLTSMDGQTKATGTIHISTFIAELHSSMDRLRKATPSLLTDENKDLVKHLKVQKRSLFAETLKELRLMGLRYNLSSKVLERQSTTAKVVVAMRAPDKLGCSMMHSDYYFHKVLALMDQVRDVTREHSGDLTPAEVSRSTGYLEALWQQTISQRNRILDALITLDNFQTTLESVQSIQASFTSKDDALSNNSLMGKRSGINVALAKHKMQRIMCASEAAVALIRIQCSLGEQDGDLAISELQKWSTMFVHTLTTVDELPKLPHGLNSALQAQVIKEVIERLSSFEKALDALIIQFPHLHPIISSLKPLVSSPAFDTVELNGNSTVVSFDSIQIALFDLLDDVLSQVQDMEATHARIPAAATVPAWFTIEESSRSSAVSLAAIGKVNSKLLSLLNSLHYLSSHELQPALLTITSLAPILHEFNYIMRNATENYIKLHEATAHLIFILSNTFVSLGKSGFCTPPDKSSGGESGNEKLEGGTGLGDGEGAEDISKDIGEDEDLTELAEQEQESSERKDMQDEQDAVDMADADLQGQEDEVEEQENGEKDDQSDNGNEDDDVDDEVGDVDDLGPSAVDEKMWDDGAKDNDKDKEGKEGKGSKDDEQVAAEQKEADGAENDSTQEAEGEQDMPADENEVVAQDKPEAADEHMPEGDNLDLPEHMEMDAHSQAGTDDYKDDDLDDMNDIDDEQDDNGSEMDIAEEGEAETDQDVDDDADNSSKEADDATVSDHGSDDGEGDDMQDGVKEPDVDPEMEDAHDQSLQVQDQDQAAENAAPSDQKGSGMDADDSAQNEHEAPSTAHDTQGAQSNEQSAQASGNQGSGDDSEAKDAVGRADDIENLQSQPFKKLGNVLEQWYNQQKTIRAPPEEPTQPQNGTDLDMKDVDFEHVTDETADGDAQALGAATEEQASALEQENAVPVNEDQSTRPFGNDEEESNELESQSENPDEQVINKPAELNSGQPNAFIGDQKPSRDDDQSRNTEMELDADDVEELDIASINITAAETRIAQTYEQAQATWLKHELTTRPLAATLSEQLRLVLAPTLATKLRGDFKTGKRLNIKRIIPYIASSFKRDKIWMRRSIPSKRSYQIMIALDDSKSMADASEGDGNKVDLAFQTLALIAKSLSMLEAGDLCFLGFGQDVKNAHPFGSPFTDDAGAKIFQSFDFQQEKTDIRKLIAEALDLFRHARSTSHGATADLWQLMLIISDGVCEDHATITQLIRQAQEERIMVVFVIVDQNASDTQGKPQSIMDLQSAEFKADANGEMKVVRTKYMDTFPFRWWIVVRDVKELPVVLATALRQWFSEVVDSTG